MNTQFNSSHVKTNFGELKIKDIKNNNIRIQSNIKSLKKVRTFIKALFLIVIYLWIVLISNSFTLFAQTNPVDVSDLEFFVESDYITSSLHVATCESNFCLTHPNSENAPIIDQYCDVTNSCGEGCVRRWIDKSNYTPSGGFNLPEYFNGRNFGQDDSEKPCYISTCTPNGMPCVRGGGPYGSFEQDKYLEIQISDFINLSGPFSIFLLAKPIDQSANGNWSYFGQSSSFLRHNVSSDNLQLRVPGNFVTSISTSNSIQLDQWQIIEVHRDATNKITVYIDGVDRTTSSSIILPGTFQIGYLFSNFKTKGLFDQSAMYGDIAAFAVFSKLTTLMENEGIREYLTSKYIGTLGNDDVARSDLDIHIIENPFTDKIILKLKNNMFLNEEIIPKLLDVTGKEIYTDIQYHQNQLSIRPHAYLAKGIYILRYGTKSFKIIKG